MNDKVIFLLNLPCSWWGGGRLKIFMSQKMGNTTHLALGWGWRQWGSAVWSLQQDIPLVPHWWHRIWEPRLIFMEKKPFKCRPLSCSGKIWEGSTLFRLVLGTSLGSLLALLSVGCVAERRWAGNRPKNQGTSQLEPSLLCVDSLFCWKLIPGMADIVYLNVNRPCAWWPRESGFWIIPSHWSSLPLNPAISLDNWTRPGFGLSLPICCPYGLWGGGHERVSSCLLSFTMELALLTNPSDPESHLMGVFPGILAFHLHTEPTTVVVTGRSSSTYSALAVCQIQPCISLSNFQNNTNDSNSSPKKWESHGLGSEQYAWYWTGWKPCLWCRYCYYPLVTGSSERLSHLPKMTQPTFGSVRYWIYISFVFNLIFCN